MSIAHRKTITGLLALLCLFSLASAIAPHGAAAAKKAKRKVTVRIVSPGQNPLVNRGVLRVKVRSAGKGKIKVRGFSATFDGRGKFKPLTRVARPRFRRAGQVKVVKLRLYPGTRAQAKSCQDRDLRVSAGSVKSPIRSMVRQTAPCRPGKVDLSRAAICDFIAAQDPSNCMTPFPNDYFTLADDSVTGRRINFTEAAMPANASGAHIDPEPYRASDGFSQGQTIVVRVPGLDDPTALARTNPVGLTDPARYLLPNAPVVVINTATRERQPIWVELDSTASGPASTNLLIHPMVNFDAGTRYIVALRSLKTSSGSVIAAPPGFRYYRDFLPSRNSRINGRRSHFEDVFKRLRAVGVRRSNLYLAWDFTTASDENNSERALAMRDQAFTDLGDDKLADRRVDGGAPAFEVTGVDTVGVGEGVARRVHGTFEVPCFLKRGTGPDQCATGAVMNLDDTGVPRPNGTYRANFQCIVPDAIVDPSSVDPEDRPTAALRGRSIVYGHGLLGDIDGEIEAAAQRKLAGRGFVICGTDEIGMSSGDAATVAGALADLSKFPQVADRLQQGLLDEMFLARLMIHRDGLVAKAAFRFDPDASDPADVPGGDGNADLPENTTLEPALKTGPNVRAMYRGNSQGGVVGGALMALAPDFDRGALGVAAMNFSVLLTRSTAWNVYSGVFNPAYRNEIERPLAMGLIQMLWDRSEPNGYAHRMTTDPLPGTPPHQVLMDLAFGDHLVTNWQSNVEARTIGARAVAPLIADSRWPGVDWDWGIEPIASFPYGGSAVAYWDSGPVRSGGTIGTGPPPITNTAPASGEDPHELTRVSDTAIEMIDRFLRDGGAVTNTCAPGPCLSGGWTGS